VRPPALARVQGQALPELAAPEQARVPEPVQVLEQALGREQAQVPVPALGPELLAEQQQAG
jgi:hypothetical protein